MRQPVEIPQITQTIELGFLDYIVSRLGDGYEVIRGSHPVRSGASVTLRNRAGVEFILEVEATWEGS